MFGGMMIDAHYKTILITCTLLKFVIKLMLNFILDKESRNKYEENYKN